MSSSSFRRKKIKDLIYYIDTDSLFIGIGEFLDDNLGTKWRELPEEKIIDFIRQISNVIKDYVNDKAYKEVQRKNYNSNVTDFRIKFKQEIVAKSALFVKKKKYSYWCVDEEGAPVDEIKSTGLEIVRSETPEAVRPILKEIMTMILKGSPEKDLIEKIEECKKKLFNVLPEQISVNMRVNDIEKWMSDTGPIKGTPWHVKGVYNYRRLLKLLKIDDIYEDIHDGTKSKIVYLKKNPYGMDTLTFQEWPKEFDKLVQIDYNRMVEKYFTGKIEILLEPMAKTYLLDKSIDESIDFFFGEL